MSIQLFFFKPLCKFFGIGWTIKFTSGKDSYPAAEYVCPFCKQENAWVAGINGFNGVPPVADCCANAVPFPVGDAKYAVHLTQRPHFRDGKSPREQFIDTWDGVSGDTKYVKADPSGAW